MTLARSTLTEKDEVTIGTPKMFPETFVLHKVMKSQKMSDQARERREEPTMGSRINKKGFLSGLQSSRDNEC